MNDLATVAVVTVLMSIFMWWLLRLPHRGEHGDGTDHEWEELGAYSNICHKCGSSYAYGPHIDY